MAARLRRAEPAFADRSPSGPAKPGFVPAVRVPTGEAPAAAVAVTSGRLLDLRALPTPAPTPIRKGTTRRAAAVPPGPSVPPLPAGAIARPPEPEGRPALRAARGLGWSGFASVLLHLGVALPFLVMLPTRDVAPAGGEAETFAVEIVPAGEAAADRLARAGAAPAPDIVTVDPPASEAAAASPPEPPSPPDDASAPAEPKPIEPPGAPSEVTPPAEAVAEPPPPEIVASESPAPAAKPERAAADIAPRAPFADIPDADPRPEAESDRPVSALAEAPAAPAGASPQAEAPAPTRAVVPESSTAPPPRVAAAPRPAARPDRPAAGSRSPTAAPVARSAPPRSTPSPPSRSGADRSDGGASAATTRAGAAAARGDGQAGAEVLASYRHRVLAHLARHKQYPDSARDRGLEGRVAVTFTLSASGQVVAAALAGSSGRAELDRITLATVQRASPFPPIPPGGPTTMTFRTALRYDLR